MCLTPPSAPPIQPAQAIAPPPPPPQKDPNPPVLAPEANGKANTAAQKTGTSIFRNDLSIPTAGASGAVGTGLNIPK